ncbi:MAG: AAA family ATPase, partial [Thermoleophilia bacterium]|nr:AAA family ATPase [Thermoleophilia bacterium]
KCGAELADEPGRQERKLVTVLFCDLVGFTSRAEQMDPEEVRALLEPYHTHVRADLERFGGTVEKFIGDAVMAVFGAPIAHEDDPERAVRAALAIRDWAAEEGIQLRIGVNTGEALVTIGGEPLATGDVVNTSARLQSAAPTGAILVGEVTYRATRDRIDYGEAASVEAKGKAEPVGAWPVLEARARVTVERTHAAALVGRVRELALVEDALARAKAERSAQLATLVGVPGIGKSRLVYELFRHVEQDGELVYWRHGRCLPYGEGVTFWALGEIVKAQAGILATDGTGEAARKLHETVGDPWVESHLRPLVGLAAEEETGGNRRVESFAAWRRFLETLAEERPLVVVFEDLHWADDDLLDFVDHLMDWATDVPLLVVCTARPELLERRSGWGGGKPNSLTVSLSALSDEETARLIAKLSERPVLPAETRSELLARAGGNPLYAEQYARALAEHGDAAAVPETLQGIVAARLDLLEPDAKHLLQAAAVLGRTFWSGGVSALTGLAASVVEERLHPLRRKDFVRRERRSTVAGDTQYTFLHVLVRDIAYGQIPRAPRAELHGRAAEWIESLGRPEDHAELLVHHYLAALELGEAARTAAQGLERRAARALAVAGDRALALNAFAAARDLLAHALELMPPDDEGRPELLLKLSRALHRLTEGNETVAEAARALEAAGDVEGAAEAALILADLAWHGGERDASRSHLDRATALLEDRPQSPAKARALSETSRYRMLAGENEEAIAVGREAIAMAEALGLEFVRAHALNNVGTVQAQSGNPEGARNLLLSIELAERLHSPEVARGYNNLATGYACVGDLKESFDTYRRGLAAVERFGDSDMARWLRHQLAVPIAFIEGRWDDVLAAAEADLRRDAHYLQGDTYEHRGRIRLARGDATGAAADALAALENARGVMDPQSLVPGLAFAAFALHSAGRTREAGKVADELLALEALRHPVPHHSPWFDLAWVLIDVGRADDLTAALSRVAERTRWVEAAEALARGDYVAAASLYGEVGSYPAEAYTTLRAARAGLADAGLDRAVAFFRKAGASAWLAEAEALEIPA